MNIVSFVLTATRLGLQLTLKLNNRGKLVVSAKTEQYIRIAIRSLTTVCDILTIVCLFC